MIDDIGPILKNWKYKSEDINVRLIKGLDGKKKLQLRLDLGILQMELDGRPDGRRPGRYDSYLSYYEKKAINTINDLFTLTPEQCLKLQQETIQYYHRYLALMKLEDYKRVSRDTSRNLRVFDFVEKFSDNEEIIWSFLQYRPYVIMMNTRAQASICLKETRYNDALKFIDKGVSSIEKFYKKHSDKEFDEKFELEFLKQCAEEINEVKPLTEHERLEKELNMAVKREDYEHAALIRDEINYLNQDKIKKI